MNSNPTNAKADLHGVGSLRSADTWGGSEPNATAGIERTRVLACMGLELVRDQLHRWARATDTLGAFDAVEAADHVDAALELLTPRTGEPSHLGDA